MAESRHPGTGGRINQEIANAVVRCHKRAFGRGPVKAQAFFRGNVVVVVMHDDLTEAEHALVADGMEEDVLRMRLRFELTIRGELVHAVEELTGCTVEAFIVGHHVSPDMAADVFVLDRSIPLEHPAELEVE